VTERGRRSTAPARAWRRVGRGAVLVVAAVGCRGTRDAPTEGRAATIATDAASAAPDAARPSAPPALPDLPAPPPVPEAPIGLPPADHPAVVTPSAVALGELLFFDPRLGRDGVTACATCHDPARGWAGDQARATTVAGKLNRRHTPAIVNLAWVDGLGWDGRHATVDDAIRTHWKGQLDVAPEDALGAVAAVPTYRAHFRRATGRAEPTADAAIEALAAFVVTRYQGDAPFDRFERGDRAAVDADAEAGYVLFAGKAQCATCHVPPLYTDHEFHNLGLASGDDGRGLVVPELTGAFRTPTLRGAALHPPYFHDGSAPTLEAAIDWHLAGGVGRGAGRGGGVIDPALRPIALTEIERGQLVAFVRSLSAAPPPVRRPELP
jgi:cytochrome c peroxidase